jgi:thioredoxin-like negative regulator of GroEL
MRHAVILLLALAAAGLILSGCDSAQQKAKRLYEQGKYEEVLAQFNDDPSAAEYVDAARKVLGEKLLADKDYDGYLELHEGSPLAAKARERVAEELFKEGRYQEVLDQYGNTPSAPPARAMLAKKQADSLADTTTAAGKK